MFCIYCGNTVPDGTECPCRQQNTPTESNVPENPEVPQPDFEPNVEDNTPVIPEPPVIPVPSVAPQQPYGQPNMNYGAPQQPYGQPNMNYGAPQQPYGQPNMNYGAPQQPYGQPNGYYGAPQQFVQPPVSRFEPTPAMKKSAEIVKNVFGSTAMLIACILFSVSVGVDVILSFPNILSIGVLTILGIISVWITYSSAHKKDAPVKTTGFSMYGGIIVAEIVMGSIGFASIAIVLIILASIPRIFMGFQGAFNEAMSAVGFPMSFNLTFASSIFLVILGIATIIFVVYIIYLVTLRKSVLALRDRAAYTPNSKYKVMAFPIVVLIISGVCQLASGIGQFFLIAKVNEFIAQMIDWIGHEANIDMSYLANSTTIISFAPISGCIMGIATVVFGLIMMRARNELSQVE